MADRPWDAGDDSIPIAALQHLIFCERQFALIHIEGLWAENRLTAEGRELHERVDSGERERREGMQVLRSVPLTSRRLGLVGRADVVELHEDGTVVPVEYKRGTSKAGSCDRLQLCAQAICLEEAFGRPVEVGFLFYARTRRREEVRFGADLRAATAQAAERARELVRRGLTPGARMEPKCRRCSLLELCLPAAVGGGSARRYVARALAAALAELEP